MRFRWFWVITSIKTVIYIADLWDMAHLVAFNVLHVNLELYSPKQHSLGRYLRNHRNKATFSAISLVLGNNVNKNRNIHRRPMGYKHLVAFNVLHVNLLQYSPKQQPLERYLRNHRNKATFIAISLFLGNNVDKNRNIPRRPMGYGSYCSF